MSPRYSYGGGQPLLTLIGHRLSQMLGVFLYGIGLIAFLCGAAVPVLTVYFFLNVDMVIQWWHIVLGVGGNIGVFILSMNMLRDLYVTPLIQRIETSQNRAEWEPSSISRPHP